MREVTLTLSAGDAELLEKMFQVAADLCDSLPELEEHIEALNEYAGGTGNGEYVQLSECLQAMVLVLIPIRAQDLRRTRILDRLRAAQVPERRSA